MYESFCVNADWIDEHVNRFLSHCIELRAYVQMRIYIYNIQCMYICIYLPKNRLCPFVCNQLGGKVVHIFESEYVWALSCTWLAARSCTRCTSSILSSCTLCSSFLFEEDARPFFTLSFVYGHNYHTRLSCLYLRTHSIWRYITLYLFLFLLLLSVMCCIERKWAGRDCRWLDLHWAHTKWAIQSAVYTYEFTNV